MTANQISDHTPGPWHVDGPNAGLGAGIRDARERRIAHTAESYTNNRDPILTDEAQANARLIASAPDLLAENETLKKQLVELRNYIVTLERTFGLSPSKFAATGATNA